MKKKILIVGNSPKGYALAKRFSEKNDVFVIPQSDTIKEFATCADIREDSVKEILEFAVENGIDMTIPVSEKAIDADIAKVFNNNNQPIFAPSAKASEIVSNKALAKKTMYKLRIPTPKFGIFEKNNLAADYVKNQKIPFVIKTNEKNSSVVITSPNTAKNIFDMIYLQKNAKAIIEDYVYGTSFSYYALTDGYKALPIGSSLNYKFSLEGDGGQLTSGMGACVPNYKLSIENEYFIMDNVIYPTLEYLDMSGNPYLGIIGVNGILTEEGKIQILGWQTFMNDSDADAILSGISEDLYSLLDACVIGSFSDEVEMVNINNSTSVSVVLVNKNKINNENVIYGLDMLDEDTLVSFYPSVQKNKYFELEACTGAVMVLTSTASSISKAKEKVRSELSCINYNGVSYRKDICKNNF